MSELLTSEKLERLMADLWNEHPPRQPGDPLTLTDEQAQRLADRGVMIVDNSMIFTKASHARITAALDADDYSGLNPYEIAALNLLGGSADDE